MNWWPFGKRETSETETENLVFVDGTNGSTHNPILTDVWDGEKTPGELGSVYDTMPDHLKLRLRAYDMHLKTDIIRIITGKFFKWVVGSGLKLQSEPNQTVLGMSGISEDYPKFQKETEALFNLYAGSKYSDYNKKDWLHKKANDAFKTAFLGGDALCVIRFDQYGPNIQVIDGQQLCDPLDASDNAIIRDGIEMNAKGEHIAFWIKVDGKLEPKRIKAKSSNGTLMAWMIYGEKARIDHHRGIPVISSILEKVAKLDRFVEASVSKAEQVANVVYSFEHNVDGTGEAINFSSKVNTGDDKETAFEKSGRTANQMRQSTSNQVFNLVPGSTLKSLSSQSETTFNEFFRAVFVTLCAAVDIPEEVALQKYEQNYSSSRAAINGWEHIIEIYRQEFAKKFYEPFYRAWLEFNILSGKITSKGFIKAINDGDYMAIEAYYNARFTGKKMPHIDPAKEAKAIRTLLGDMETPLISYEQATEEMGKGNWEENYNKFLEEDKKIIREDEPTNE